MRMRKVEHETTINFNEAEPTAYISTRMRGVAGHFRRLGIPPIQVYRDNGRPYGWEFEVPKSSFKLPRPYRQRGKWKGTPAQRKTLARGRAKQARAAPKIDFAVRKSNNSLGKNKAQGVSETKTTHQRPKLLKPKQ